jgi:beta-xylosidase
MRSRGGGARAVAVLAAMVAVLLMPSVLTTRVYASLNTFNAPVYGGDFPDPSILYVGGRYWAYATGAHGLDLQVMSSPDLVTWSQPTEAVTLPRWASHGATWAPGVMQFGSNLVMYYAVHDLTLGKQCISIALSTTKYPAGPFIDSSQGPLICQTANGGSIDPNPFVDPVSHTPYLLWKSDDNSIGNPTHLWAQQLSSDGMSLASGTSPSLLLTETWWSPWQPPAIEGPTMVRNGSRYYLFYGANNYDAATSGIGYATSSSPLGPFTDKSVWRPWLSTKGSAQGAQGPSVFTDATNGTRFAFAAWYGTVGYENGGVRSLWIGTLGFSSSGTPSVT